LNKTKQKAKLLIALIFLLGNFVVFAQKEKIELLGADELEGIMYKGQKVNFLNGNVRIKSANSLMSCNKAYMFVGVSNFDAFGNVSIQQSNGTIIYGDSLFYNGASKIAKIRGNIRVVDKQMTLTTRQLDYNMSSKIATYYGGGTIIDNGSKLTSRNGTMNSAAGFYTFKGDVNIYKDNYHIVADTLKYINKEQKALFYGPTYIYSKDQTLYCESGTLNTRDDKAWFNKNAWVQTKTYKLSGDSLFFDNKKDYGFARKNVKIESYTQNATIYGDYAIKDGSKNLSKVYGNAILINGTKSDTTFIAADTLISIEDTVKKKDEIHAINNVSVIKGKLSAICDSLVYNSSDSLISFFKDPVLWSEQNQMTGNQVFIHLKNEEVEWMDIIGNSFVISQLETDSTKFNQIKGNKLKAFFDDGDPNLINVDGNAESIYFAFNEEKEYTGMNKVACGNMKMLIVDGDMDKVKFYDRPIATFTPPQMVDESMTKLQGFLWKADKRPLRNGFEKTESSKELTPAKNTSEKVQKTDSKTKKDKDKKDKKDKKKKGN
jgi:lipopolysaccharide export system protein LptA